VFAPIALHDLRNGLDYTLTLRSTLPGDNRCTCGAPPTALSGQCDHIAFALEQLAADPETAEVLEHGWQPLHSEVYLRYGARHVLRWLAGSTCPEPLEQAAEVLLDARGDLRLDDSAALPALRRQAEAVGQELRVDEEVWRHLAHQRDAGNRVQRLEQAWPEGTASAGLQALLRVPLRPYQLEGALFATVAGHALLADEEGLGKTVQAVATAELLSRQFGVERVLVLCSPSQQAHWQEAFKDLAGRDGVLVPAGAVLDDAPAAITIADFASARQGREAIAALNPELLIVDEAHDETEPAFDFALLAGLQAPYALLIARAPLEARPQDLLPRVMWLDPYRLGSTARFLRQHLQHDDAGSITGYTALDQLDTTLRHLMLRRRRADVAEQLPESVDVPWPVELTAEQRARHDEAARPALPILARWQRSAYVSDADQRKLVAALREMQAVCHGAGTETQPKLDALLGLLPELLERPDTRVVVFAALTQTALQAGRRVGAAGFDHVVFGTSESTRHRLQGSSSYRVVLCSDAAGDVLPAQPLKTIVVQLDPPGDPQRQQRRLQRVQGDSPARNVPVIQLIAQHSLEAALWALPAATRELVAATLDGQGGQAFLQGEPLAQFMAAAGLLIRH